MGRRRLTEADYAFRREVAAKFREAMKERRFDQTMAARDLGITKQAMSQYLAEKSTPQGEILARACARWNLTLKYRNAEFGRGAFATQATNAAPEVLQMDLFREPQVFANNHLEVTVSRAHKFALQVTIKMKHAGPRRGSIPVPRTGSA